MVTATWYALFWVLYFRLLQIDDLHLFFNCTFMPV